MALGLYIAFRQGSNIWHLYRSGEQVRLAEIAVQEAEEENQRLKERLIEIDNPEFIEKEAREKLGYAREGETILVLPQPDNQSPFVATVDQRPSWMKWWDLYIRI